MLPIVSIISFVEIIKMKRKKKVQEAVQVHALHLIVMSLQVPLTWNTSLVLLFLMTLNIRHLFCKVLLHLGLLSNVSSGLDSGYTRLKRIVHGGPFSLPLIKRHEKSTCLNTGDGTFDHWLRLQLPGFSTVKLLSLPLAINQYFAGRYLEIM